MVGYWLLKISEGKKECMETFCKYFRSYKGRGLYHGQKVHVYRNLNKSGTAYSIRDKKTGLVVGHAMNILLNSCTFKVNPIGRQRVLETKRKSIHAWIEGHFGVIHANDDDLRAKGSIIKYDPYQNESFVHGINGEPIYSAGVVYISEDGVFAQGFHTEPKPLEKISGFLTHRRREETMLFPDP